MTNPKKEELKLFKNLIVKSDKLLPIPQPVPTFLELSGYPHYENVISNILQFFFDSSQGHGLSHFFLKSILQTAGFSDENEFSNYETINVFREEPTDSGNRIDLVIETDSFCIAIENKIYHNLRGNDLRDYQDHIEKKNREIQNFFVVLALDDYSDSDLLENNAFCSVTYDNFFTELENRLGKVISSTEPKLLIHLTDFIKTIRNMTKSTRLNMEFIEFLEQNKRKIESLHKYSFKVFKNEIKSKAEAVDDLVDGENHNFKKFHFTKPNHLEYVQGYKKMAEFYGKEIDLQIKLRVTPAGYFIEIWNGFESNPNKFQSSIEKKLDKSPPKFGEGNSEVDTNDHGFVVEKFNYEKTPNLVGDRISYLMNKF